MIEGILTKLYGKTGEIAQQVKHLPCKFEDLGLNVKMDIVAQSITQIILWQNGRQSQKNLLKFMGHLSRHTQIKKKKEREKGKNPS